MSDDILDRFLTELANNSQGQAPLPIGDSTVDRLPVIFVIDHSSSTQSSGDIVQINKFLQDFATGVESDSGEWSSIRTHLDLAIIAYSSKAEIVMPWTPGEKLTTRSVPKLSADGLTSMAAGLEMAAGEMMRRLADYKARQTGCFRGYIFNITDGNPTDMAPNDSSEGKADRWQRVKTVLDRFEHMSSQGSEYAWTFHLASRTANRDQLRQLAFSPDRVVDLGINQTDFAELFKFIRVSLVMAVDSEI